MMLLKYNYTYFQSLVYGVASRGEKVSRLGVFASLMKLPAAQCLHLSETLAPQCTDKGAQLRGHLGVDGKTLKQGRL
jgi:hypothetical protein